MGLSELELINEYNNCYFISLINVLNGIADGEKITRYELSNRIANAVNDTQGYFSGEIADEVFGECRMLFDIAPDKTFRRRTDSSIPICFSVIERIYIRSLIGSRYGKLFLSENETEEIMHALGEVPDIPINDYHVSVPSKGFEYNDSFVDNLHFLLNAVKANKEIIYSNRTRTDIYENKHGYPVRIEYSALYDLFQLSLWSSDENRPVKVNIHSMYDIGFTGNIWSDSKSPAEMMETRRCKEPIIIELSSYHNTFERANILFSMYKTITETGDNGNHIMKLFYYEFDEKEIVDNLFSFGPNIMVLSPTNIIGMIKEKIRSVEE